MCNNRNSNPSPSRDCGCIKQQSSKFLLHMSKTQWLGANWYVPLTQHNIRLRTFAVQTNTPMSISHIFNGTPRRGIEARRHVGEVSIHQIASSEHSAARKTGGEQTMGWGRGGGGPRDRLLTILCTSLVKSAMSFSVFRQRLPCDCRMRAQRGG